MPGFCLLIAKKCVCFWHFTARFDFTGKVHGGLARAGKVKGQVRQQHLRSSTFVTTPTTPDFALFCLCVTYLKTDSESREGREGEIRSGNCFYFIHFAFTQLRVCVFVCVFFYHLCVFFGQGRAKRREQYIKRFVNVNLAPGARRVSSTRVIFVC